MKFSLCFNLGTIRHIDYQSQLDVSVQAGFDAVGLRMDSLEDYLSKGHTLEDAKQCLKKNNLTAVEMDFLPDWIYTKGEGTVWPGAISFIISFPLPFKS